MITKFDSLYAGHVDMTDVGYGGTAVNDRRFGNDHLITVYSKAEAIAKTLDENGFDTMWMAEHHFQPEGYECIPNLIMLNVHLAHLTKNIKFGCGFNIAPMWHPLRLAEDFATADILTKGRVIFGVGRGYHTREVETFGSPLTDQDANREKFEEAVEIIFKAFNNESFSHKGTYYTLPPEVPYRGYTLKELTLVPRPLTLPVECWQPIQGGTQRALDFMVKHGIKGILGGGVAEGGAMDAVMTGYRDALVRAGKTDAELGEGLSIGFHYHLAPTVEQAMDEAQGFYEENTKMFGPLRLHRGMTDEQIEIIGDPRRAPTAGLPTIQNAVETGAFLAGPPDRIIERLKAVEKEYPGLDRIGVSHPVGTPQSVITEQLEWFAKEVMPAFKSKVAAKV
ncbi:MAG: LLM class flavin-dependent oxidoreductase [Chloroflexi bacterium]|nr:LLM class flavin-dependent oxidoreductase [Chloroflexota bacterium]MCI0863140.1 LLM class flavin-dependent oxidoreductase [Chloroflexota bacterium]MCI0898340.1 LLM class flavin-dependent oxidoreductase [Chloroflexota bacterium]MCI0901082.1 LLM class flavin-dependent oxidoreductase [Chloroflexota bacterium]